MMRGMIWTMGVVAGLACVACSKADASDRASPSAAASATASRVNGGSTPGAKPTTSASSIPYPLVPAPQGGW